MPYGFSRCEVKIDSADALPADDESLFAVERSDPERVLFVHESGDRRSPLYFNAALTAAAESAFTLQTVPAEQFSGVDPSKFAFVVLSDVVSLPSAFESDLDRYVRGGGSVLIAAGTNSGRRPNVPVFGERILDSHYYSRDSGGYLTVGDSDPSHPSTAKFARWAGVKFYYATAVDPSNSRVVARLTDQTPIVLDKKIGEGRVLLFASGLDNLSNDFPLNPIFVPFVEQTARYLSGTGNRSGSRLVDSYLDLRTAKEQAVGVEVIDPNGRRPLSLKEATTAQSYQLTQAGFYQLRLANGRQDVIGVNPDRRESNLDVIPDETLALWRGNTSSAAEQASATRRDPTKEPTLRPVVVPYVIGLGSGDSRVPARQPVPGHAKGGIMSTREQLNSYIQELERRLRLGAVLRGAAILTSAALATTIVLVLIINLFRLLERQRDQRPHASVSGCRGRGLHRHHPAAAPPHSPPGRAHG